MGTKFLYCLYPSITMHVISESMRGIYTDGMSLSPVLPTKYAHQASQLINGITKKIVVVMILVFSLFFFSVTDALRLTVLRNLIGDDLLDNIMVISSVFLLAALTLSVRSLLRSRNMLNQWSDIFERNSINAGMSISMTKISKEEAIRAISETVEEIGQPLQNYMSNRQEFKELIDVHRGKELVFDVLIDKVSRGIPDDLRNVLTEYGAVIIMVVDGKVDERRVEIFSHLLLEYISETRNKIGLPIIIGEEISEAAYKPINTSREEIIKRIILVEKSADENLIA